MVKKIGSFLLSFLFLNSTLDAKITLRAVDTDGNTIKSAALGEQFILEVAVQDEEVTTDGWPTILGLHDNDTIRKGLSTSLRNLNNNVSYEKRFSYTVRFNKVGALRLGPATINTKNGRVSSNQLNFEITLDPVNAQKNSSAKTFMVLDIPHKSCVVGEKVLYTLRFYYLTGITLQGMVPLKVPDAQMGPLEGPYNGSEYFHDQEYGYIEWRGCFYPEKAGIHTISGLYASYIKQRTSLNNFFALLQPQEEQQVYADPVSIRVHPMPPYKEIVTAIGDFNYYKLTASPTSLAEGQAFTVTISLKGSGNMERIEQPTLLLPDGFNYYPSKTEIVQEDTKEIKKFEYAVHALKTGTVTIPAQKFVYYDPAAGSYKTLISNSLEIIITPDIASAHGERSRTIADIQDDVISPASPFDSAQDEREEQKINSFAGTEEIVIQKIIARKIYSLPFWFIISCFLLPLSMYCLIIVLSYWRRFERKSGLYQKRVLKKAQKLIKKARKENNPGHLYKIILNCFSKLQKIPEQEVSEITLQKQLLIWGFSYEERQKFYQFWQLVSCYYFTKITETLDDTIFSESQEWFEKFLPAQRRLSLYRIKFNQFFNLKKLGKKLIIIFSLTNFCYTQTESSRAQELYWLRKAQYKSTAQEYKKLEQQISELKEINGVQVRDTSSTQRILLASKFLPILVWQLLFLCSWFLLLSLLVWVKKYYGIKLSVVTATLITGCFVFYQYYYFSTCWAIIKHETVLRFGPAVTFPERKSMQELDEVRIKKQVDQWLFVNYNGYDGWLSTTDVLILDNKME